MLFTDSFSKNKTEIIQKVIHIIHIVMHIFSEQNLVIKGFFFFKTLKNVHKVDKYVDNSVYIIFMLVLKRDALYNLYNDFLNHHKILV